MKDEYVIINKTKSLKRLEELEKTFAYQAKHGKGRLCYETNLQIIELKQVLSKSTPLTPEIEKAFDAGSAYAIGSHKDFQQTHKNKKDYTENLKLYI